METNKSARDVISADGNQAAPARITVSPDSLSPSHPGRKVCALINTLSGNRTDAAYLASELRLILGAANVQDISLCFVGGTEGIAANERARRLIHEQATICGVVMIAGGDGTVSFVMDLVDQVLSDNRFSPVLKYPRLSIIPLGTGNDLSCSLGFGGGFRVRRPLSCCTSMHGNKDAQEALDRALITKFETMLNRCLLRYHHSDEGERVLRMTNYFSVGFDAFVAQKFDSFRRRNPNLCSSRAMNKLAYACFGFGAMFRKNMLRNALELSVDGIRVPIPDDIHAVVVVNIDKYAGGVTLWNPKESQNGFRPQQSDDGILEVCGLKGPTDLALNITGLRKGARALAQGCCIKLVCSRPLPMQWDGEVLKVSPFQEQDGVVDITIEVSSSARFLSHRP